ncbi:GntR family transcriptional regulator [Croceicoccus sp. Ery5]|jgi:GntR family transcriptional regulator|uniref:GntR family transcriptional regulator n=1 Tax=Croceicoccus sp. Ery5 TaxID=1703340 RepID=UPI001E371348|nr:GntR family transcriptional regulator [Croceicoccus sp. Ery5]
MTAKVNGEDPLYVQIARKLKAEMMDGLYPVGSQMPTENELCDRFSVSRYTVRGAIGMLRDEGLVAARRGAGTTVLPPPPMGLRNFGAMSIEDLLHFAQGSYIEIESIAMRKIDRQHARQTGIPQGEEWLNVSALGREKETGAILGVAEYWINRKFAGVSRLLESHKAPIFPLIEDLFGVVMTEVEQTISACVLDPETAAKLEVEPGSPALEVRHAYRLEDGTLAQLAINTHPSERYRHRVRMQRVKPSAP